MSDGKACLEAALRYLKLGWSILALCPPDHVGVGLVNKKHSKECKHFGKTPWHLWKEFQSRLPSEDEVRALWRQLPNSNVGIALGPVSGIVRVDTEGPAGEAALLARSGGDLPTTLEFVSGRKDGTGRGILYRIPPGAVLRTTYERLGEKQEIRFQAKGAQTVLPPSRHRDGGLYAWLPGHAPGDVPVATMPGWLLAELSIADSSKPRRTSGEWNEMLNGVSEGSRNETAAAVSGKIIGSLADLTDGGAVSLAFTLLQAWNERNDPPLDDDELKTVFASILKKDSQRRSEADQKNLEKLVEQQIITATQPPTNGHVPEGGPPDWHLVKNESKPPTFLLRSPYWKDKEAVKDQGGYIVLAPQQIAQWTAVRVQAVAQADASPPPILKSWWKLLQKLLDHGDRRAAPLESNRPLLVAHFLWQHLSTARLAHVEDDGSERLGSGPPVRLQDGRTAVKADWLVQQASYGPDGVRRVEIIEIARAHQMKKEILGVKEKRSRWWVITSAELEALGRAVLDSS